MWSPWGITSIEEEKLRRLKVPISQLERNRIQIIRECRLLAKDFDSSVLDRLVYVCARSLKSTMCCVSVVEVDKIYAISHVGMGSRPFSRDLGFCSYAILDDSPCILAVDDATKDERFMENVLVKSGLASCYIGTPVTCSGRKMGTLCVFYPMPKTLTEAENSLLQELALVVSEILTFRREQILCAQHAVATMLVGIFHPLKQPIAKLLNQEKRVRQDYEQAKRLRDKPQSFHWLFEQIYKDFEMSVHNLQDKVELSLDVAVRYMSAIQRTSPPSSPSNSYSTSSLRSEPLEKLTWCGKDLLRSLQKAVHIPRTMCLTWEMCPELLIAPLVNLQVSLLLLTLKSLLWLEDVQRGENLIYMRISCTLEPIVDEGKESKFNRCHNMLSEPAFSAPCIFCLHIISSQKPIVAPSGSCNLWRQWKLDDRTGRGQLSFSSFCSNTTLPNTQSTDLQVVRLAQEDLCRAILQAKDGGLEVYRESGVETAMTEEGTYYVVWLPCRSPPVLLSPQHEPSCLRKPETLACQDLLDPNDLREEDRYLRWLLSQQCLQSPFYLPTNDNRAKEPLWGTEEDDGLGTCGEFDQTESELQNFEQSDAGRHSFFHRIWLWLRSFWHRLTNWLPHFRQNHRYTAKL
eukprot:scaffold1365_cov163-Ochromonas_danica.AAC.37